MISDVLVAFGRTRPALQIFGSAPALVNQLIDAADRPCGAVGAVCVALEFPGNALGAFAV